MEAGEAWSDHGGGTSGALWGGALLAAGQRLAPMPDSPADQQVTAAVDAALQAVRSLGQASLGDKTMLDALEPFHGRLHSNLELGMELEAALAAAAEASLQAAQATADLLPKRGRARPHGERSLGHPDPGAMSLAYCLNAALRPHLDPPNR
jgi:dihydroxyacetone kinase